MDEPDVIAALCLNCGLCCNGVLFKDVELLADDDPEPLEALGWVAVPRATGSLPPRLPQPCMALCADNRCRVYTARPARCRQFECGVLKEVTQGQLSREQALSLIRKALQSVKRIKSLLRQLGDADEQRPLSQRFRRTRRRLESSPLEDDAAERFAELTLETHRLNLLVHSRFYTRPPAAKP